MAQEIEFVIRGKLDGVEITPRTIGLSLFNQFNQEVEEFIKGSQKGLKLNEVRVRVESGSYKFIPALTAALATSVAPDLNALKHQAPLDRIDSSRAEIVSKWQKRAKTEPHIIFEIRPRNFGSGKVVISDSTDFHYAEQDSWVQVEKYIFGTIQDMGGIKSPNVHLALEGQGKPIIVSATENLLRDEKVNRLYHKALLRVRAEQHSRSGELRNTELIEFADYAPRYDENALNRFIEAGTKAWADVPDAAAWVRELRGGQ